MAKTPHKSNPSDNPNHNPEVGENARTYPWTGKAVNNTPISLYLTEAGVHLAANYHAPANEAEVTYQSADHLAREMANVHAIESVHGFDDALILSDLDAAE